MKLHEVASLKDLKDLGPEWQNVPEPKPEQYLIGSNGKKSVAEKRKQSLYHQDMVVFNSLDKIVCKYENDLLPRSFPDPKDRDYTWLTGPPDEYLQNPDNWIPVHIDGSWFDDDMRTGDNYPDAHEVLYIRKTLPPQIIKRVEQLISRHNHLMNTPYWRWPT